MFLATQSATISDTLTRLEAAVADRYTLGRELGRGGMATVYLAQDLKHDRPVAIKVLRGELGALLGPERFQREIRLAAQLQHPNILPVYDSGTAGGVLWYTMPYVEGDTLRGRLRRRGRFSVAEAVPVLQDLARALAYAHRRGVIHRDVKPENVMVGDDYVLLADFGVAKPLASGGEPGLTLAGGLVGTPAYMAPEQVAAEPTLDHRADLYALGVLAYELLVGEPPFTGLELGPLLVAHVTREPVPLSARRPDVSAALAEIVGRCLRKEPAERWSSAEALCHALRGVVAGATVAAPPDRMDGDGGALEDLEAARAALDQGRWREAYVRFTAASAAGTLEAEDLERLAEVAWWVAEGAACCAHGRRPTAGTSSAWSWRRPPESRSPWRRTTGIDWPARWPRAGSAAPSSTWRGSRRRRRTAGSPGATCCSRSRWSAIRRARCGTPTARSRSPSAPATPTSRPSRSRTAAGSSSPSAAWPTGWR
jgi:hypothetical protein